MKKAMLLRTFMIFTVFRIDYEISAINAFLKTIFSLMDMKGLW